MGAVSNTSNNADYMDHYYFCCVLLRKQVYKGTIMDHSYILKRALTGQICKPNYVFKFSKKLD